MPASLINTSLTAKDPVESLSTSKVSEEPAAIPPPNPVTDDGSGNAGPIVEGDFSSNVVPIKPPAANETPIGSGISKHAPVDADNRQPEPKPEPGTTEPEPETPPAAEPEPETPPAAEPEPVVDTKDEPLPELPPADPSQAKFDEVDDVEPIEGDNSTAIIAGIGIFGAIAGLWFASKKGWL